jgi:hypothetical protein
MWQQIIEFGRRLLAVIRKQQEHEEDIKELRQEVTGGAGGLGLADLGLLLVGGEVPALEDRDEAVGGNRFAAPMPTRRMFGGVRRFPFASFRWSYSVDE